MPQIFSRRADFALRFAVIGGVAAILILGFAARQWYWQSAIVPPKDPPPQPIPFSHSVHAGRLGLDCRYCHEGVEKAAFAGIPTVHTCMGCHEHVWRHSDLLEPLEAAANGSRPLVWNRVTRLPDFAFFHHGIHVSKGFGCDTCHGRVDQMEITWQAESMTMKWCLDCHREPERKIRPRAEVTNLGWEAPPDWERQAEQLAKAYGVRRITDCSACHR